MSGEKDWLPPLKNVRPIPERTEISYTQAEWEHKWRLEFGTWPPRHSLKEIDDEKDAWLICNLILRRTEGRRATASWYDEKDNSSYHITLASSPPPKATFCERSKNYYRNGDKIPIIDRLDSRVFMADSVSWTIGYGAVLQMDFIHTSNDFTPEAQTINWMQGKLDSSRFKIPKVIRHEVQMGRRITFLTQLYGPSLAEIWMSLSFERKEAYRIAVKSFCVELAKNTGKKIGSCEGKGFLDSSISLLEWRGIDRSKSPHSAEAIQASWAGTSLAPALSDIVFSHNNLAPENIICVAQDSSENTQNSPIPTIGIVNWKAAGFSPKAWVRTKFAVAVEYDLPTMNKLDVKARTAIPIKEISQYRWGIFKGLGEPPYSMPEVKAEWWRENPHLALFVGRDFISGKKNIVFI